MLVDGWSRSLEKVSVGDSGKTAATSRAGVLTGIGRRSKVCRGNGDRTLRIPQAELQNCGGFGRAGNVPARPSQNCHVIDALSSSGRAQVAVFVALAQRVFQIPLRPVVVHDLLRPATQSRGIRIAPQNRSIAPPHY